VELTEATTEEAEAIVTRLAVAIRKSESEVEGITGDE